MRGVSKTLVAALAALLLIAGLAACGGGGDDSSSTEAASQGQSSGGSSPEGEATNDAGEGKSGSAGGAGKSGDSGKSESASDNESGSAGGDGSSSFVPKPHEDSGGGSEQFKAKGGDNSVQEFGAEADTSEFDAAATVLHNFLDARAAGDWGGACTYVSSNIVESFEKLAAQAKQLEGASCAVVFEKLTNPAAKQSMQEEAAQANVRSLRTEGEQAFAIYTGIDGTVLSMPMVNEDGAWKVASLAGTPLL